MKFHFLYIKTELFLKAKTDIRVASQGEKIRAPIFTFFFGWNIHGAAPTLL
jgi:hypothetical protein